MVALLCLLIVVPLVSAGNHDNNMMMQQMQQMMNMMAQSKGWGGEMQGGNNGGGDWWNAQSSEDYEAYQKWCRERQAAMEEQKQQQAMMKQWEEAQAKRKMEAEHERQAKEAAERHESMMTQWKMWQMRLNQQHEFENLMGKFTELKHHYMFAMTMEFLKFCKCSDFTDELQRYFMHGDLHWEHGDGDDWDLDDLNGIDTTNAQAVAQAIANLPKVDQLKAFFGGLANSMCDGARVYVGRVRQLEAQYKFLDRLM